MSRLDPNELQHHAARMLENPAWTVLFEDARRQLGKQRDRMKLDDPQRHYVSIAETLLTRLEKHAEHMTKPDNVSEFNAANAARVA